MWHRLLRSENSKLLSYRWCQFGIAASVFIAPTVLVCSDSYMGTGKQIVTLAILQMLYLGQIGAVILGATIFGQEFDHCGLRTSLLAVPSRKHLFMTKIIILSVVVVITGFMSTFLCIICLFFKNGLVPSSNLIISIVAHVIPVIISGMEIAFISAGVSIILRSYVMPIAILFPMILGLSQMIFSVFEWVKVSPVMATLNLFFLPVNEVFLSKGLGLLTQLVWSVCLLWTAGILLMRRDVK